MVGVNNYLFSARLQKIRKKFCLPKAPETIFITFTCTPPQSEISLCDELLKKPGFGILKSQVTIFCAWEMINILKGYTTPNQTF
jgi:hypothetical protein